MQKKILVRIEEIENKSRELIRGILEKEFEHIERCIHNVKGLAESRDPIEDNYSNAMERVMEAKRKLLEAEELMRQTKNL